MKMDGLFSSRVITAYGKPDDIQEDLHPAELASVERAVEKRRMDFRAGRTLARRALRQLGLDDVAIPVGEKREPVWPAGIVGTISHTRDYCGVAIARQHEVRGLGFDVERISDVRAHLRSHIATDEELGALMTVMGGTTELALALAFSGKESFFKFQYPLSRQWIGLREVRMLPESEGFRIIPSVDIAGVCARGETTCGKFKVCGDFMMTAIEIGA